MIEVKHHETLAPFLIAAAAFSCASWPGAALGQDHIWKPRGDVVRFLSTKYNETPAARGLDTSGGIIELLTAPGDETWTMIVTMPNGLTGLIATGEFWQTVPVVNGAKH